MISQVDRLKLAEACGTRSGYVMRGCCRASGARVVAQTCRKSFVGEVKLSDQRATRPGFDTEADSLGRRPSAQGPNDVTFSDVGQELGPWAAKLIGRACPW